jgi:hypothetical protein
MTTIKSIKKNIIEVFRGQKIIAFQIDVQYLNEIKMWPSGIKVGIKFDYSLQKHIITPIDWVQNSVNGVKLY